MRRLAGSRDHILACGRRALRPGAPARDSARTPQATFKSGVDLVTVSVAVRTENGRGRPRSSEVRLHGPRRWPAREDSRLLFRRLAHQPRHPSRHQRQHGGRRQHGPGARSRDRGHDEPANDADEAALFTFDSELAAGRGVHQGSRAHTSRQPRRGRPGARHLSTMRSRARRPP